MTAHGTSETVAQALTEAVGHHQAGRLKEAEAIYRQVLETDPENPDALHLLGVAARQAGRIDVAIDLIRRAIAGNGKNPSYYGNLGTALDVSGRREEALAAYRRAIEIKPDYPEVLFKLGSALRAADRPREALDAFRRAVKFRPGFAEAYNELGCVLKSMGRADVAIKAFGHAVKARPDYADAYNNLGNTLRAADRLDDAILAYRRAVEIKPDFDAALFSLSAALLDKGDARGLVEVCDACLARDPGNRRMLSSKAVALNELGDRDGVRFLLDFDRFIRATRVEAPAGFDSVAAFNAELARQIRSHPTLEYERSGHATRLGQHTGDLLLEAEGAIALLKGMMEGAVRDYVGALPADPAHPFLADPPERWRLTAWAVVMDKGGHQLPHIHSAAWLSGVYYVQLPNIGDLPEQGQAGWLQFGRPQPGLNCTAEPETRRFRPEEGLMYLFPSYFYHDTVPIETEDQRISIAFDVLARD